MFTAELKINGSLVGVLYGHNKDGKPESTYHVEYYEPNTGGGVTKFEVKHTRSDGLALLVSKCLKKAAGPRD